jgi:D-3-phosphoglycerate dehydrogenase
MKPIVWNEVSLHPEAAGRLRDKVELIHGATWDDLPGIDAAIIGGHRVDAAFIDHAGPNLKLVVRHGIGYDDVDVPAATERDVLVANTPDGPTESTAEHAVGLMLALAKRIVKAHTGMRSNLLAPRIELRGTELLEKVLGVVGCGRIGSRVTEIIALGMKMRVIVYDPYLEESPVLPTGVEMVESLDELLAESDFVTLHPPLTPDTKHLIGERELRLMKSDAYLINTSRGPVIDEAALIRVLEDGHLAGVGLDVFDPEPPAPDNPLLHMDHVVVTPHIASGTWQGIRRMSQGVADQILQVIAGERPTHCLNPSVWPGRVKQGNT